MRLDAYKLCKTRLRTLAEKTGGIGVWEHELHIVAVISVLANCWLIGFTSPQFLDLLDGENGGMGAYCVADQVVLRFRIRGRIVIDGGVQSNPNRFMFHVIFPAGRRRRVRRFRDGCSSWRLLPVGGWEDLILYGMQHLECRLGFCWWLEGGHPSNTSSNQRSPAQLLSNCQQR